MVWPWLSINWLTIITSILNSWQWGIKYQDGLEANTLEGIIFYPRKIFNLIRPFHNWQFFCYQFYRLFLKIQIKKRCFLKD